MISPANSTAPHIGARLLCGVTDAASFAAVDRARANGATVLSCGDANDVAAMARAFEPAIVVVDIANHNSVQARVVIGGIRAVAPDAYVIGVLSYARSSGEELAALARAGLTAVSLRESGSLSHDIGKALDAVRRPALLRQLLRDAAWARHLDALASTVLGVAANAATWPNVAIVARHLGCSPRDLQRRFEYAQLGRPHEFLQLTRWILIGESLRLPGMTVIAVADALGFVKPGLMRDAVRRSLGDSLDGLMTSAVRDSLVRRLVDRFGSRERQSGDDTNIFGLSLLDANPSSLRCRDGIRPRSDALCSGE